MTTIMPMLLRTRRHTPRRDPRHRLVITRWIAPLIAIAILLAHAAPAVAQDAAKVIILVRHAEKVEKGDDPALLPKGRERAVLLASMLKDAGITTIFTSTALRTKETADPTAKSLKLAPVILSTDAAKARTQVLGASARVLVVGHSNTVPDLIAALGGPKVEIADGEFDRLFVLTLPSTGPPTLVALRYGSAPGTP